MGATNHTTNYELSQFIGTDKPSWLNDYNNDMLKIDTAVKANATAASGAQSTANTADGKADANALAIQTLNTQINTPDTGLAATVAAHTLDITGINSTIGTTPLTTVAQTLTGAIEEVKGSIPSVSGTLVYNGQGVIDITADGIKNNRTLLNELYVAFLAHIAAKSAAYRFKIVGIGTSMYDFLGITSATVDSFSNDKTFTSALSVTGLSNGKLIEVIADATASNCYLKSYSIDDGSGVTDNSAVVPGSGSIFRLRLDEFTINA